MPHELIYDKVPISSLDEAVERMQAFARAHIDFEPSLVCERLSGGRRRWLLSVTLRRPPRREAGGES